MTNEKPTTIDPTSSPDQVFLNTCTIEAIKNEFKVISNSFENLYSILSKVGVKASVGTSPLKEVIPSSKDRTGRVNGFTIFYSEIKPQLESTHPDISSKEVYNLALDSWKNAPEDKKKEFSLKASEINQIKFPKLPGEQKNKKKAKLVPVSINEPTIAPTAAFDDFADHSPILEIHESDIVHPPITGEISPEIAPGIPFTLTTEPKEELKKKAKKSSSKLETSPILKDLEYEKKSQKEEPASSNPNSTSSSNPNPKPKKSKHSKQKLVPVIPSLQGTNEIFDNYGNEEVLSQENWAYMNQVLQGKSKSSKQANK